MKLFFKLLAMTLFFSACSGMQPKEEAYPEDLAGKQKLLKEKKAELQEITKAISKLENEIAQIDPELKKKGRLVTTQKIDRKTFQHFVEIQGAVEAEDLVDATSEISGRIISLNVKEGQLVKRGQVVAKLDVENLEKQIAELEKALELANTVYERQDRLWKQRIRKNAWRKALKRLDTKQKKRWFMRPLQEW